ncbi:MAG: hypothetical protein FJW31_30665 [Acidobacteria bacterium]|nr:hypothetical protein [Acidobacteriota bacterium]
MRLPTLNQRADAVPVSQPGKVWPGETKMFQTRPGGDAGKNGCGGSACGGLRLAKFTSRASPSAGSNWMARSSSCHLARWLSVNTAGISARTPASAACPSRQICSNRTARAPSTIASGVSRTASADISWRNWFTSNWRSPNDRAWR